MLVMTPVVGEATYRTQSTHRRTVTADIVTF